MKPDETKVPASEIQYQVVAARRGGFDALLWQTPVLSLTAQAFLFTIALGHDTGRGAQIISALLALVSALASMQLLAKHRYFEVTCSKWLEAYERSHQFATVHERMPTGNEAFWLVRLPSYRIWQATLVAFASAACLVLFFPSILK